MAVRIERIPAQYSLRASLGAFVVAAALEPRSKALLIQSAPRNYGVLSRKAMQRAVVYTMV